MKSFELIPQWMSEIKMLVFLFSFICAVNPPAICLRQDEYFSPDNDYWITNCNPFAYRNTPSWVKSLNELTTQSIALQWQYFAPPWDTDSEPLTYQYSFFEISNTEGGKFPTSGMGPSSFCDSKDQVFYIEPTIPKGYAEGFKEHCPHLVGVKQCCRHNTDNRDETYQSFNKLYEGAQYTIFPRCYNLVAPYMCNACRENLTGFSFYNGLNQSTDIPIFSFRMCEDYAEAVYRECRHAYWRVGFDSPVPIIPQGYSLLDFKRLNGIELFDNGTVMYDYEEGSTCISYSSGSKHTSSIFLLTILAILSSAFLIF